MSHYYDQKYKWSQSRKNNTEIRSKFGPYQIMLYEEIQNNGGCLEATVLDRGWFLQPREDQKDPGYGTECDPLLRKSRVIHDDVIKWKHFPRNWPFVRGTRRSPVNFPHKGQYNVLSI